MASRLCAYEADSNWRIVIANDELCCALRCMAASLVGCDVRDLIRPDWRSDFRSYVAHALVGTGDDTVTLPIVTPRAGEAWFTHTLEPILVDGTVSGYRAWLVPHLTAPAHSRPQGRDTETHLVWNFEPSEKAW